MTIQDKLLLAVLMDIPTVENQKVLLLEDFTKELEKLGVSTNPQLQSFIFRHFVTVQMDTTIPFGNENFRVHVSEPLKSVVLSELGETALAVLQIEKLREEFQDL